MAVVSFEINDFRLGVIGAKRMGSGDSSTSLEGFLRMEETILVGSSLTKRPPIKYIARTIDNVPRKNQFLSYGEFLFYAVGETRAFIIEGGDTVKTYEEVHKITKFAEENVYDIVTLDTPLDSSKGEFILGFIGRQPMEIYNWEAVAGQTNTYRIYSITSNKGYAPNNLESFKQIEIKTIPTKDYVDAVGGTYVTGSSSVGFNIDSDGTITDNAFKADSICMVGSEIVVATSYKTGIQVTFFFANNNPQQGLTLVKEIGYEAYWIRSIPNGLILATEMGIFLLVLDGQNLKSVMQIDDKVSSNTKPIQFKQYILYVDNGGESLGYIRTSFSNSQVWASAVDLAVDNDIFIGRGGIKRLALYYHNNNPNIVALTNDGSCLVGQLNENSREAELVASMSQWFKPYHLNDIAVFKQSSSQNRLTISATYQNMTFLGSITAQNPPLFNQTAVKEPPCVDFYSDIQTDLMFDTQQNLMCTRIDNSNVSFRVTSNADFFKKTFFDYIISDGMLCLRVCNFISSREAICEEQSGSNIGGDGYAIHAGTYVVRFNNFSNLDHLYNLMVNNQKNKLNGYADDEHSNFKFNYNTGNLSFPYCSRLMVGLAYDMVVCTSQLLPFGYGNRIRCGRYSSLQVTTQFLGYKETYLFIAANEGAQDFEFDDNAALCLCDKKNQKEKFIVNVTVSNLSKIADSLVLWFSSDSVNAPFISNISVKFDYENI